MNDDRARVCASFVHARAAEGHALVCMQSSIANAKPLARQRTTTCARTTERGGAIDIERLYGA